MRLIAKREASRRYSVNSETSPLSGILGPKSLAAIKSLTGQETDEILESFD